MPILSILEYRAFQELLQSRLPERLAALEAAALCPEPSRPLAPLNAARRSDGQRLREAVNTIITTQPDATAKHVLRSLERSGWAPLPSVRTVQRHVDALRQCDTHV